MPLSKIFFPENILPSVYYDYFQPDASLLHAQKQFFFSHNAASNFVNWFAAKLVTYFYFLGASRKFLSLSRLLHFPKINLSVLYSSDYVTRKLSPHVNTFAEKYGPRKDDEFCEKF